MFRPVLRHRVGDGCEGQLAPERNFLCVTKDGSPAAERLFWRPSSLWGWFFLPAELMRILWAEASHMSIVAGMGPAAGEAAPAIQDRLNDPNEGVRKIAAEALNAVTETGTP